MSNNHSAKIVRDCLKSRDNVKNEFNEKSKHYRCIFVTDEILPFYIIMNWCTPPNLRFLHKRCTWTLIIFIMYIIFNYWHISSLHGCCSCSSYVCSNAVIMSHSYSETVQHAETCGNINISVWLCIIIFCVVFEIPDPLQYHDFKNPPIKTMVTTPINT